MPRTHTCYKFNTSYEKPEIEHISQDESQPTGEWHKIKQEFNIIAGSQAQAKKWLDETVFKYSGARNVEITFVSETTVQAIIETTVR